MIPTTRRWAAPAAVLVIAVASPAAAARRGTIEGRVKNAFTGEAQAGVTVTLTTGGRDAASAPIQPDVVGRTRTGADGRYRFTQLATGPERFYALDATFDGGLFAGGAITLPDTTGSRPAIDTTLLVWPTTTDPTAIIVRRNDIFVVQDGGDAGIIESVTVVNRSDHAYIGRGGGERPGAAPTLGFALPEGADAGGIVIVESDLDIPAIVPADFGFAATVAIPPGERKFIFSYRVPGNGGTFDLSRTALYPTLELSLFAADPLTIKSNRTQAAGVETIGGKEYGSYQTTDALDAGDPIQVLAMADAGTPAGLLAGVGAGIALVAGLAAIAFARGRRRPARPAAPAARSRGDLVEAIADLDLHYKAGEVTHESYETTRNRLKAELAELDERARSSEHADA